MSKGNELCPHCIATPMTPRTNGWGSCYLECLDCGYYDAIRQRPDPFPTRWRTRKRKDGAVVKGPATMASVATLEFRALVKRRKSA